MRIAITSNGPGEFAGWVRPLVAALLRLDPATELTLFFVPDDYATGREPDVARALFPHIGIVSAPAYVRFALGGGRSASSKADLVQYLGGDLMHAARVHARLGGRARSYKFSRKRYARTFERVYAQDDANARELTRTGMPPERIEIVGNLAIDGALAEASGAFSSGALDERVPPGAIVVLPGTRRHEIAHALPFFLQTAVRLRAARPDLSLAFAISPFTTEDELRRALASGGHRNAWGARGRVVGDGATLGFEPESGGPPFAVVRDAMRYAGRARLAVTLPGTKCIELAALGVPAVVCVPLNAPEVAVINGPLQYLDRIPVAGAALKRVVAVRVDARFPLAAQPNMDAGEALMPELRGALMPGDVARRVASYADDAAARASAATRLRALYAHHAGAAERMARALLEARA